jgi:hypothetical protein
VLREYIAAGMCLVAIMVWSIAMQAPLDLIANPNATPNPSKAPWYFVGLQELLVYFDPWIAGVLFPGLIIGGLTAIPYIDPTPKGVGYYSFKERPFANTMFLLGIFMWFALIGIGYYCRGPNFAWYWPWESWLIPKAPPPDTWSLFGPSGVGKFSWLIGVPLIGAAFGAMMMLPKMIQKELPLAKTFGLFAGAFAALLVVSHFAVHLTGLQIGYLFFFGSALFFFGFQMPQAYIRNLDWVRYLITMVFVVSTMSVLLKMGARLGFDIKYLLTLPAVSLNI